MPYCNRETALHTNKDSRVFDLNAGPLIMLRAEIVMTVEGGVVAVRRSCVVAIVCSSSGVGAATAAGHGDPTSSRCWYQSG
jgi:hypothetical protein